jgi:hypothetical protein
MRLPAPARCWARREPGGSWATARRGAAGAAPWKMEKEDTARSPVSGERGWLVLVVVDLEWSWSVARVG